MSPYQPPELSSFAIPSEIFPFFVETIVTDGILLSLVKNCAQMNKKSETKQRGPTLDWHKNEKAKWPGSPRGFKSPATETNLLSRVTLLSIEQRVPVYPHNDASG